MSNDPNAQIPIDQEVRRRLQAERNRTGISGRMLLAGRQDIPAGLIASHISRWANGLIKYAPAAHVQYVFEVWGSLCDDAGRIDSAGHALARPGRRHPKAGEHWVAITDDMREALRRAIQEGRLTVKQLVEMDDAPPELTRRMINAWLYGESATTRQRLWGFVMAQCRAAAPDTLAT